MKAILISIKPKWVAKILNGEKTIEIRKTCPEVFKHLKPYEGAKLDVYIYCTKDKNDLVKFSMGGVGYKTPNFKQDYSKNVKWIGNGKVVAKFTLNKVEEIKVVENNNYYENDFDYYYETETCISDYNPFGSDVDKKSLEKLSCLETDDLDEYLEAESGYAWHISNLVIFDKPRELGEFKRNEEHKSCLECPYYNVCEKTDYIEVHKGICYIPAPLTKAPQSWQFIEIGE